MSGNGNNFDGLDEATLLAFVEGELGQAEEAGLRRTLAGRPGALASLEAMRADRAGLRSLPELFPPANTVEAAMARAHREALHGLRVTEAAEDEIPVSRVVPVRASSPRWFTARRVGLAAAAVLGVAGGLTLMAVWPGGSKTPPGTDREVAKATAPTVPTHEETPGPDAVAVQDPPEAAPEDPVRTAQADPVVVPLAPRGARVDESARVLALARSGRLALRVTARTPARSEQQLAALEARSASSPIWRARADASAAMVAVLAKPAAEATPVSRPEDRGPDAIAGVDGSVSPMIIKPREIPAICPPPRVKDLVATLRIAPTLDAINAVRSILSEQLGSVVFAELAEAAPVEEEPASIESMLWWSGSPAQWARWAVVPVVIER